MWIMPIANTLLQLSSVLRNIRRLNKSKFKMDKNVSTVLIQKITTLSPKPKSQKFRQVALISNINMKSKIYFKEEKNNMLL